VASALVAVFRLKAEATGFLTGFSFLDGILVASAFRRKMTSTRTAAHPKFLFLHPRDVRKRGSVGYRRHHVSPPEILDRPPAERVRAELTRAYQRRRAHAGDQRFWRAAPALTGAAFVAGISIPWTGWPWRLPLAILGLGLGLLIAYAWSLRRPRVPSDRVVAAIDAEASLGGELRSASWFAGERVRDSWTDLHLSRAAATLQSTDWSAFYPPVRPLASIVMTVTLVCATLLLPFLMPKRTAAARPSESAPTRAGVATADAHDGFALLLTPELRKQLEELLASAELGKAGGSQGTISASDLQALVEKIDSLRVAAGQPALGRDGKPGAADLTAKDMQALSDRARRAAQMASVSPELREALSQIAERLAETAKQAQTSRDDAQNPVASSEAHPTEAVQSRSETDGPDVSAIQAVNEPAAGGGAGVILLTKTGEQAGSARPGLGLGGGSDSSGGNGTMADLDQALRRETIEASSDAEGQNILTESRRKTERGTARSAYTHATAAASDRARTSAAAPVPEGRRAAVQTFFTRKQ
jgi:hypothetical protein